MLTTEQLESITVDVVNGRPLRVKGKEAERYAMELRKDVLLAKRKGWSIEIPGEIAVDAGE